MQIANTIIIVVAVLFTISWIYGIRQYMQIGNRASQLNINATFLYVVSIILVLIFNFSALHILWMIPTSILFGAFYQVFPFSLLTFLSLPFEKLIYIGLDWKDINRIQNEMKEVVNLMRTEKLSQAEAIKIVKERRTNQILKK